MWYRSASFILDKNQDDTVPPESMTLSPPPPSISTAQNPNPNLNRNMSMSAYYQTRAAHHGVVTSDWLVQSQEAANSSADVAVAGQEIFGGGNSERAFSVIEEFNNWRKQPDLAEAVAAIRALAAVIRNSEAKTMMELEIELKKASDSLKSWDTTSISLTAGCDLFMRYVTRTSALEYEDFNSAKSRLIERAEKFGEISYKARRIIAMLSQDFIFDGCTILVHGFSRVVLEVLKTAAQNKKLFRVFCTEGRPDRSGLRLSNELAKLDVPVKEIAFMADNNKLHIAMFPWLAFGHMIPWLELAKLIAQKGHKIIFISTPRNIDRLPKLSPNLASSIQFVKIQLPHVDNLRENAEATVDLPYNEVQYLKKAYDCLREPISQLLKSLAPDWLLFDFTAYWLPAMASQLGIPNVFFSIYTAASVGYFGPSSVLINGSDDLKTPEDYTRIPKWVPFPTTVAYRLFESRKIFNLFTDDVSDVSSGYRFGKSIAGCDIIAVRSCMEFEPEWLKLVEELHRKPVIPVCQLPTTETDSDSETDTWRSMKEWLDKQEKCSVVYVAFGSEAKPSQEELTEIALGLELSKLPFFWVLKKRLGPVDTEPIEFPDGFEERTKGRGVVYTSWAPQLRILSHDSVGGFLTHSGWSSVVEALQFGKPLIVLTFYADQGLNAKLLVEKQIAQLIQRDEGDGSFTMNSVAESLRLVLVDEEGQIYRDKAMEMRGLFGDRDRQNCYVDNFLNYLKKHRAWDTDQEVNTIV